MPEIVYADTDIRYFAKDYPKIPFTFLNTGDLAAGQIVGLKEDEYADAVRRTTLAAEAAAEATQLSVDDASIFKVGDTAVLMKADGSVAEDLGAITAVDANNNTITVTTAVTAAHAIGSYVYVSDGTEKALAILAEPVIDEGEAVVANAYLGGAFEESLIIGLDAIAKADLGARTVAGILIVPGC